MKTLVSIIGGAALLSTLAAGSAFALPLNPNRPLTIANGSETALQQILNDNFNNTINAVNGQSNVGIWSPAENDTTAYRVTFLAGHTGYLGIYSYKNPSMEYFLMGKTGTPNSGSFNISNNGTLFIDAGQDAGEYAGFGQQFGFFWRDTQDNPNYKSYTEDSKNAGLGFGQNNDILALSYLVPTGTKVKYKLGSQDKTSIADGNNDWVLAFEDHPQTVRGDGDFNDAVIYVEDMNPVPEPGTILLLGGGLLGLGLYGRKRAKNNA